MTAEKQGVTRKNSTAEDCAHKETCGPFEVSSNYDSSSLTGNAALAETCDVPIRNLDCENYDECLELAIALNWQTFSCSGCNGTVNENLKWRISRAVTQDKVARFLCPSATKFTVIKSSEESS